MIKKYNENNLLLRQFVESIKTVKIVTLVTFGYTTKGRVILWMNQTSFKYTNSFESLAFHICSMFLYEQ